ncbi:hypothetical protein [Polaribacter sp. Q13]|uniref:hypothetical protein n=1 Tax=Polaribacter sp. Q13 TaxID=2806551 RepID=UPI00193BC251|nr:hypothetical protein [Polaribacter sp. Q13]QVY66049.1 hypothetical protein JOP69_01780 [Polaribacter sp. Q13]
MKKLVLFVFALMLTISINAQKKTFEGAIKHAGLTQVETQNVMKSYNKKVKAIKAIRKEKLSKEDENAKIKEAKKTSTAEIKALISKEKQKAMNLYWQKK